MIYPIGRWVIDSACAAHVELNRDAAEPVTMSINISALQLQDQELCDHLCATASRYGIAHSALILEVTESAIIDNEEQATQTLTRLRRITSYNVCYTKLLRPAALLPYDRIPVPALRPGRPDCRDP